MRYAIIDLGTNTFNLLIVEGTENNTFNILFNDKLPVKLGLGGINTHILTPDAKQRGIKALLAHKEKIRAYNTNHIFAFATSAIRGATNGLEFKQEVWEKTGIDIKIISGDEEAQYIYEGVKKSFPFTAQNVLILDIGGGSNEFIIANEYGPLWARSFDVGIARLLDRFKPSDPITQKEIQKVTSFLEQELADLLEILPEFSPLTLVGASGSFDTFREMMLHNYPNAVTRLNNTCVKIEKTAFDKLSEKIIATTTRERKQMPALEPMRIEMIVLASIFVNFTLEKTGIKNLFQTDYSLKEGVLTSILAKQH